MREGASLEKHLKDTKELADKLVAIEGPVSDEDQVKLVHNN
jgi:hypothetical protein